jgi:hypothetical protein
MQGGAGETECLLFGLGATVGSVSQNIYLSSARSMRGGSMAGPAIQTLNQGRAEAAGLPHARLNGRVAGLRGLRSSKSADF